jgi:hypothetical protein
MDGACSAYGEERGVYRILVGKPQRKGTFNRPKRRCIKLARDGDRWRALVNAVMKLRIP